MQIISFDVGIQNLAYCIFEWEEGQKTLKIVDWKVVNLLEDDDRPRITHTCNCILQTKKNTATATAICGNKALYKKGDRYFCLKHAKSSEFLIPKKEYTIAHFKKMKKEDLCKYYITHFIPVATTATTKPDIINSIMEYYSKKLLEHIEERKINAGEANLIDIGFQIKKKLDKIENIGSITHVIIENQISPIATRMKTIQGMLAQYFIMKSSENIHIEFISSLNKLKGFETTTPNQPNASKSNYKNHKKDSVAICMKLLESVDNSPVKIVGKDESVCLADMLHKPKKDDYADAFLQGIWYLKNKHGLLM